MFPAGFVDCVISEVCFRVRRPPVGSVTFLSRTFHRFVRVSLLFQIHKNSSNQIRLHKNIRVDIKLIERVAHSVQAHVSVCVCVSVFIHMSKIYFGCPLPVCKAWWERQLVCLGRHHVTLRSVLLALWSHDRVVSGPASITRISNKHGDKQPTS